MSLIDNIKVTDTTPVIAVDPLVDRADTLKKRQRNIKFRSREEYNNWKLVYSFWNQAISDSAISESRRQRYTDHEFYDGDQWTSEDIRLLEERNQSAYVFNEVKSAIDWLTGAEKQHRVDYKVLSREADGLRDADAKSNLLKYLADVNKEGHARSHAFKDAVVSGLGWVEVGIQDDPNEERLFCRYVDWRDIYHDPHSRDPYLTDARYLHRLLWLDIDIATALFPDSAVALMSHSATDGYDVGISFAGDDQVTSEVNSIGSFYGAVDATARTRVCIKVTWYKVPVVCKVFKGDGIGRLNGMVYDDKNEDHVIIYESGFADVVQTYRMQTRVMYWVGETVLLDMKSPYRHNRFPFVPFIGFRKFKDGSFYGVVRGLRDAQEDLNKRRSKALYILSTNKVLADGTAAWEGDWQKFSEELASPDGIMLKKPGTEIQLIRENEIAEQHLTLMMHDAEFIEKHSGVSGESMGRETNAESGRAILARQAQGNVINMEFFDNLRLAIQTTGQIELSLIEQFYGERRIIRLVDMVTGKGMKYVEINKPDEESDTVLNDITATQADFVIDTQSFTATMRQRAYESLSMLMSNMPPEISINLMDLLFSMSDFPMRDELVARMRKLTGQTSTEDETDPEKIAEIKAKQQSEAEMARLSRMEMEAKVQNLFTKNQKMQADIMTRKAGIKFDEEKLRIEKAKALNEMVEGLAMKVGGSDINEFPSKGPYNEKGLKSNNESI